MHAEYIQVTYTVRSPIPIDAEKKAKGIASGQTTDTWTPNERSGLKKLEKHRGVVLGVKELYAERGVPHAYQLTIGYPPANTENDIPTLLTMIFGKISLDGKIRLEDIAYPASYLKGKGPRHGIEGIRKQVGERSKPLAMAIFKPCVGLSPRELGAMFLELAMGGMHLVKDDEILPDLSLCPTENRLDACLKAAAQARKITGQRTLYAVNLTGPVSQLLAKAKRLARQGAECFLFNVLSYGFGALEELRAVGVPIMAHPALAGSIGGSDDTGISYRVLLGSLMRLGGADIVLFPSSYGTVALPSSETDAIREAMTEPMSALRRSFPGPSAGIHPGLVPRILKDYGQDVIINAGGGVHGHPQGARAGALAFRQAIDHALQKQDFKKVSEADSPELAQALQLWGHG
jgi:2,3-diketo-5-methylthiopentyl-1-phosphate enolase